MRTAAWVLTASLASLHVTASSAADGLTIERDLQAWGQWQGRVALGMLGTDWRADAVARDIDKNRLGGLSVMGDYYFLPKALPGTSGGFRATSGLVYGARPTLWAGTPAIASSRGLSPDRQSVSLDGSEAATLPYLGFGYTGLSLRGGWSFSADLGLLAHNPAQAVKFGRVFTGTQSFDEVMRDLRIAPVLQLGVSYAF
jgi:hypothetical protein